MLAGILKLKFIQNQIKLKERKINYDKNPYIYIYTYLRDKSPYTELLV